MREDRDDETVLVLDRAGRDRPALDEAFHRVGLRPVRAGDLTPQQPLGEELLKAMHAARFVLAVLDDEPLPLPVLFEMGLARGAGIPLAVLDGRNPARRSDQDLFLDTLLPSPRLYSTLSDVGGLTEQLEAYTQSFSDSHSPPEQRITLPVSPLRNKRPKTEPEYHSVAERRVAEILETLSASVIVGKPGGKSKRRFTPDLMARFQGLDPSISPVFIEVTGVHAHLERTREKLADALAEGNAHLGLLVTLDDLPPRYDQVAQGRVIARMSLSELERDPGQLIALLSRARNLAVHG